MSGIYIIRCRDVFKIGIARDVKRRLVALQIGNPYPLELVGFVPVDDPENAERYLHTRFSRCRLQGEWFRLTAAQVEEAFSLLERGDVAVRGRPFTKRARQSSANESAKSCLSSTL